jgi:hypothetical protein
MPPRRSARVAAVAERESSALAPLPHGVVLDIFARLPVNLRARCKLVCRGWSSVLTEVSLWTRLNLSPASGVTCTAAQVRTRVAAQVRTRTRSSTHRSNEKKNPHSRRVAASVAS